MRQLGDDWEARAKAYLTRIQAARDEGKLIYYLDESYVHENECVVDGWRPRRVNKRAILHIDSNKGIRFNIIGVLGPKGVVHESIEVKPVRAAFARTHP